MTTESDKIAAAMNGAEQKAKALEQRFQGTVLLTDGKQAVVNLPLTLTAVDVLLIEDALHQALIEFSKKKPINRLVLPV
jgi:hypothetical protein